MSPALSVAVCFVAGVERIGYTGEAVDGDSLRDLFSTVVSQAQF